MTISAAAPVVALEIVRKHHAATNRLLVEILIAQMRAAGRTELVHYAGAAHRDRTAWEMCLAYLAKPAAPESVLKSRALQQAGWGDVSPADLRASNPGMR